MTKNTAQGERGTAETAAVAAGRQVGDKQTGIRPLRQKIVTGKCQGVGKPGFQNGQVTLQTGCARVFTEASTEGEDELDIPGTLLVNSVYAIIPY